MLKGLFGSDDRSTLVDSAFDDVTVMLQQSAKMLELSVAVLLENAELDVDFESMDDVVDESERMVRRTILQHLAVNPRQDLVASLILVSMVQDAERIGDFARGLAELVRFAKRPRSGPFAEELLEHSQMLPKMFEATEQAFRNDDSELAMKVIDTHRELKPKLTAFTERVAESDLTADMAIVYAAAAKIFRRIGAHLANICSSVIQPFDRIRHGDETA
jgi:phosphate uptake regulator